MSDLHRLVYTSRNLIPGTEEEQAAVVAQILEKSQRNNAKVGVTGALLFNSESFAQVLEGPRVAVEATFERIQRDPRHSDVSVLQCEPVEGRGFSDWSMAFIGRSMRGRAVWSEIAGRTQVDLSRIEGDRLFAMLHEIVVAEEGAAAEAPSPTPAWLGTADRGVEKLDVERLRAELRDRMPPDRRTPDDPATGGGAADPTTAVNSAAKNGGGFDVAILKAALAEERERTTDLRRTLDDARMALAAASDDIAVLRRHRDVWAERARALAMVLVQEPGHPDGVRAVTSVMDGQGQGLDRSVARAG